MSVEELLIHGARAVYPPRPDDQSDLGEQLARTVIVAIGQAGEVPDRRVTRSSVAYLSRLWECGWMPIDVLHATRRALPARSARLIAELIADDPVLRVPVRPPDWSHHLDSVAGFAGRFIASVSAVERWRRNERITLTEAVVATFEIIGFLTVLPKLPVVSEPPSRWAAVNLAASRSPQPHALGIAPKMLERIRALLAKAEGTDFPEEAEAFTVKAQELMARHAIDEAMLHRDRSHDLAGDVRSRRIHLDNPYAKEKAQLLGSVADANGARTVWDDSFGWATIIGFPVDLDLVELLFTSLLVQMTRAMADAGAGGGHTKSASFRRAFVLSFASRIHERLVEAGRQAGQDAEKEYGTALVPVLAERKDAVDRATETVFPRMRAMRSRTVDGQGWRAGRTAADLATLHSGSTELRQRS